MNATAKDIASEAVSHWNYLAPVLTAPQSEDDHEHLVAVLGEILDAGGADETPPLTTLAERIGELVEAVWGPGGCLRHVETRRQPIVMLPKPHDTWRSSTLHSRKSARIPSIHANHLPNGIV